MTHTELETLLPTIIGAEHWTSKIIPAQAALVISNVPNHKELCELVPVAGDSTRYQLWTRKGYDLKDTAAGVAAFNRNRDLERAIKLDHEQKMAALKQAQSVIAKQRSELAERIIGHFTKIGLPKQLIEKTIIGKADCEQLAALVEGLKATGVNI